MKKILVAIALVFSFIFVGQATSYAQCRPVKIVLKSIQYGKYNLASRQISYSETAKIFMGKYWKELNSSQKKEIINSIKVFITKISLKKGHDLFKHLSSVVYGRARIRHGIAYCKSTIVIYQNYKKMTVAITFLLKKKAGRWKIVEMNTMGEGLFEGIYEDQVKPTYKKGGIPLIMKLVRQKVAEVKGK